MIASLDILGAMRIRISLIPLPFFSMPVLGPNIDLICEESVTPYYYNLKKFRNITNQVKKNNTNYYYYITKPLIRQYAV